MKDLLHIIFKTIGIKSDRTKNITKHIFLSIVYKGGSILMNFLLVPLTINFLDTENYGIWLTLSSFIAWFSFFDIGLGNGLRNKFAEAKAKNDMSLARGYVSSAYYTIGFLSLTLILIFTTFNLFIDWTHIFNTSNHLKSELSLLMPIVFGFFCIQLVVKLITTIYTADQHHSMQGKINFFTQTGSLLLIWIMTKTCEGSLFLFGIIFSAFPVMILILFNLIAFKDRYSHLAPSFKLWKKEYLKEIFGLGTLFFIIQISGIILFATDNFIISKIFSPTEVVPYNIAYKYISIASMVFSIIAAPYWSSITDAYYKSDLEWIKNAMKNFQFITLSCILLIACMLVFSKYFYQFWIGDKIEIPLSLTALTSLFFCMTILVTPYTMFLNGTGKIKIQAIQSLLVAILNIPLSFYFAVGLNLKVNGVILATIVCFIPSIFLSIVQYKKIIQNNAYGIWNK